MSLTVLRVVERTMYYYLYITHAIPMVCVQLFHGIFAPMHLLLSVRAE
jgi:hypothetical protein